MPGLCSGRAAIQYRINTHRLRLRRAPQPPLSCSAREDAARRCRRGGPTMLNSLPASFGGRPSTPTREMAPLNRGFSFNWGRGKDDAKAESGPGQHGQRVESAGSGA